MLILLMINSKQKYVDSISDIRSTKHVDSINDMKVNKNMLILLMI